MNVYKAKKDIIIRTAGGKRIQIKTGQEFCGGYDFRNHPTNNSVIFVNVNGNNDEIFFKAGQEFMDNFRFMWHANRIKYEKVEIVKRQRILK